MIYLDNGATSLHKPPEVAQAVIRALRQCANPGRGGHKWAMEAAQTVYSCRELASKMFACQPEQVIFTANCTHGLNIAINALVRPGDRVLITGFEHNAVTRPLFARNVQTVVAGRKLFDRADTLQQWEDALKKGVHAAVMTHCSNVFGYILPVEEMAALCRQYRVPFIIDGAQSAGVLPIDFQALGADFIAMPGHKGLLGPQGTGLLLCASDTPALMQGGTGTDSVRQQMPLQLPEALEAGTLNVPGIAGLGAALSYLHRTGTERILRREQMVARQCVYGLQKLGFPVFSGPDQTGTVSFLPHGDCEDTAAMLDRQGIAVRAGLHCAPLAHESAGTLQTGTVRVSFGHDATPAQAQRLLYALRQAH